MGLEDLPQALADAWGFPLIGMQIVMCGVVLLAITLPVIIASRGENIPIVGVFFALGLFVCYGIGWVDVWIILILIILDAGLIAVVSKDALG